MNKILRNFISSYLAGMCIVMGATAYLLYAETNKFIGAFLFTVGLYTIILFGLNLYTGKVGLLLDSKNKPKYLLDLLICVLGNFAGVISLAFILKLTRNSDALTAAATPIVNTKMNDSWYSILVLSFMCGIMIYLAVKGHQKAQNPVAKAFFLIVPIIVFIICGYEHCVANTCYFVYAGIFNWKLFGYLLLMIVGNGLGSIFFDGVVKLITYLKNNNQE